MSDAAALPSGPASRPTWALGAQPPGAARTPQHRHFDDRKVVAAVPLVGARLAIVSILVFWLFYFLLNSFRVWLVSDLDPVAHLVRRSGVTCAGIVLSIVLYLVLRLFDRHRLGWRLVLGFVASIPVSLVYAACNFYCFVILAPTAWLEPGTHHLKGSCLTALVQIVDSAAAWYFFIVAWAILYIAMSNAARSQIAERQAAEYRVQAQSAQLRALRYQINPHFLFNTLNSVSTLVMRRSNDRAEQMLMTLAAFLRTSLAADPTADVTLAEEIRAQRLYLEIEQVRFPERLRVVIDVPVALESAQLPGLLLQPLVENAVRHGVARSRRRVALTLAARSESGILQISVTDDADPGGGCEPGLGVGLRNVRDRLAARFGPAASVDARPGLHGGFAVTLRMPLIRDGAAMNDVLT